MTALVAPVDGVPLFAQEGPPCNPAPDQVGLTKFPAPGPELTKFPAATGTKFSAAAFVFVVVDLRQAAARFAGVRKVGVREVPVRQSAAILQTFHLATVSCHFRPVWPWRKGEPQHFRFEVA